MRRAFVGVAIAATIAVGGPAGARGVEPKVLGWSSDGLRFLYVAPPEDAGELDESMGNASASVTFGVVLDARTGLVAERYLLASDGEPTAKERAEWKALPGKAAWQALVKSTGAACTGGRAASDGATTADVQLKGKSLKGAWKKDTYGFSFVGDEMAEKRATLLLQIARAGKAIASAQWSGSSPMASAGGSLSGKVSLCWAPGGKRVAWIVTRNSGMMRDPGEWQIVLGPTAAPRVQLVADKGVLAQAAAKVGAALEAAGVVSTSAKASNEASPRPATVIYAAEGFEADAQRIAAAVPGGATVAKLDWKAPFDVVVGIGATALK